MSDEERIKSAQLLGELHGQMTQFFTRYERDREETTKRYQAEREERKAWRDEIQEKVDSFEKKMNPVIRDHQFIVRGGKWVTATCISGFALFKGWVFVKDHLKP